MAGGLSGSQRGKSPADQMKELKIVLKGDEVFAVQPEGEGQKCKFKLGTSKTLNTIDLIPLDKGKAGTGIYSLKNGRRLSSTFW